MNQVTCDLGHLICYRLNTFLKKFLGFLKVNLCFLQSSEFSLNLLNQIIHIELSLVWFDWKLTLDKELSQRVSRLTYLPWV
jgi:hypothetical protein